MANKERQESKKSPERISDHELGNLLAAIGNHEGKALLLASMKPNTAYTRLELRRIMNERQGEYDAWKSMDQNLPMDWCLDSLGPIGLVTRELIEPHKGIYGYEKTEYGKNIGDALSGHLLTFSENHPTSLYHLLGKTGSNASWQPQNTDDKTEFKNRSPLTRYRIFSTLVKHDLPMRETDLLQAFIETHSEYNDVRVLQPKISQHLQYLARNGIITYETVHNNEPYVKYTLNTERPEIPPPSYYKNPSLTQQVFQIITNNPGTEHTSKSLYEQLLLLDPKKRENSKKALIHSISGVLSLFEREGYADRGRFHQDTFSELTLTDRQRTTLVDFADILERFRQRDPEFFSEGRKKAQEIISSPARFSHLLERARNASPQANRTNPSETSDQLLRLIAKHPHSTVNELRDYFQHEYGRDFSYRRISVLLSISRKSNTIIAERKGNTFYYSLPESSDQKDVIETVVFSKEEKN